MIEFISNLMEKKYDAANALFEERMDDILNHRCDEMKKAIAAKLDESAAFASMMGTMSASGRDSQRRQYEYEFLKNKKKKKKKDENPYEGNPPAWGPYGYESRTAKYKRKDEKKDSEN